MSGFIKIPVLIFLLSLLQIPAVEADSASVVINEIHYDPDVKTELVEFVELYNAGTTDADLSGWYFSDGISFTFPPGVRLPANCFLVVTQDHTGAVNSVTVASKYSVSSSLVFGPFEGKLDNDGEEIRLCDADGQEVDRVEYKLGFPWPTVGDSVPSNTSGNGPSIQLVNPLFDNDLGGSWRSAYPTPAAINQEVYADNIPPHIRQVNHSPKQPKSNELITITAKVTDPDKVVDVTLFYQVVEPGNYIRIIDSAYRLDWTGIAMHDDGLEGDRTAGDYIYTVLLPSSLQVHRRLVRYRIRVTDAASNSLIVPYADDPQPNFAYFVYDGVPAWRGAIKPGDTAVDEYSTDVMRSLPVYHLISKKSDVETCTWFDKINWTSPEASVFKWYGTLVYDGRVYDHIRYRTRGGVWRYAMGKNMWKFDFNRGHYFQAKDNYGEEYKTRWNKINLSACIQQGDYQHRGEQGMFEAVTLKLFNMMGVPAPKTHWIQLRIIDEHFEDGTLNAAHPPLTSRGTQYDCDFWGLYLAIEQMDGRFLDEHDLPDGNLYKIENYNGELNNQGPTAVTDKSDLSAFGQACVSVPTEQWWRQNVDLPCYYSYRCVVEGAHHGDVGYGKNYFFYLNPQTNIWSQLPWDVDLTWANNMYGNGEDIFRQYGGIHRRPALFLEFQNRLREFYDLLYNAEQINQLLDEFADIIDNPNTALSIVDADRDMWDYHWVMGDAAYPTYLSNPANRKAGQGRFYQKAATKDFRGMVQIMKDYVTSKNRAFETPNYDPALLDKPAIIYTGFAGFPANDLTFQTSIFSDPQGSNTFAAMKWRIAEIGPGKYEINAAWESQEITEFSNTIKIPDDITQPGCTYRVRCRMKDNTGLWSHWSDPIQFVAGEQF